MFTILAIIYICWYIYNKCKEKEVNYTQLLKHNKEYPPKVAVNKEQNYTLTFYHDNIFVPSCNQSFYIKKNDDMSRLVDCLKVECGKKREKILSELKNKMLNAQSVKEYDVLSKEYRRISDE